MHNTLTLFRSLEKESNVIVVSSTPAQNMVDSGSVSMNSAFKELESRLLSPLQEAITSSIGSLKDHFMPKLERSLKEFNNLNKSYSISKQSMDTSTSHSSLKEVITSSIESLKLLMNPRSDHSIPKLVSSL